MESKTQFVPDKIVDVVGDMSGFILEYALALAATSVLAMALLEAWKSIRKTRERFHMQQIHKWISAAPEPAGTTSPPSAVTGDFRERVYRQLILLTTGQVLGEEYHLHHPETRRFVLAPSNALFALDSDRMMGQIQEAADIVLTNPSVYPELYRFLTTGARQEDIETWEQESTRMPRDDPESREQMKGRVDAFARLNKFIKRRLDSLQITMGYDWANWNQWWSIVLGAVLLFLSMTYIELSQSAWAVLNPMTWIRIFIASLIGGIVAPVAKDLVVALKKVRTGG